MNTEFPNLTPVGDIESQRMVKYLRCSACWGHLVRYPAPERKWTVACPICMQQTRGYVSKTFVDRSLEDAQWKLREVKINLRDLIETRRQTPTEILRDLGISIGG